MSRDRQLHLSFDTPQADETLARGTAADASCVDSLCTRIADRLGDRLLPESTGLRPGSIEALQWQLRALATKFDSPGDHDRATYSWPASALTYADQQRLRILGNLSGLPATELLHLGVVFLFQRTREDMLALLTRHRETGTPLEELAQHSLRSNDDPTESDSSRVDRTPTLLPNEALDQLSADDHMRLATDRVTSGRQDSEMLILVTESGAVDAPDVEMPVTFSSPLVRPDRQWTYDGRPFEEWPEPESGFDVITVDRLRTDIDGPPHRFAIWQGDSVEVFLGGDELSVGEVQEISHPRRKVSIQFVEHGEAVWCSIDNVYPFAGSQAS